jgi:hypothetical protein
MIKFISSLFILIIILFSATIFAGCSDNRSESSGVNFVIIEIDGHEYIFAKLGYGGGLVHKEDCKHPNHKK